ncbi:MAG: ribbon-helix-helix domain-containing protein [Candidatus Bathyarchaeia archaeon]
MSDIEVYQPKRRRGRRAAEGRAYPLGVSFYVTREMCREMNALVSEGRFRSRSELIRTAIALLITEIRKTKIGAESEQRNKNIQ